jgi:hypothetical protein
LWACPVSWLLAPITKDAGSSLVVENHLMIFEVENGGRQKQRPTQGSMPLWKTFLAIVTIVVLSLNLSAKEHRPLQLEGFSIGCDFRKFKSRYKKQVKCNQTLYPLIQTANKKQTWNRTVTCSSEKGVSFDSRLVPRILEKNSVAELNAVFESKKLAMLEYIVEGSELEPLENSLTSELGPPARQQFDESKDVVHAEWMGKNSKIEIQLIRLQVSLTRNGFIQIDKGSRRTGINVRLSTLTDGGDY